MQEDGALLRKNGDIWRVPSCVHIGPLVARRIRYALTHLPLRYRVLIGQDGIFRSSPIYVESFPHQYQLPSQYIMGTLNNAGHDQKPLMPHIAPPHTDLRAEFNSAIQKHEKTQSVTLVAWYMVNVEATAVQSAGSNTNTIGVQSNLCQPNSKQLVEHY